MTARTPYCPIPGDYGIAQLDIARSLEGLSDPKVHKAVEGLGTAKCLVYFCTCLQLPYPQSPWCKYILYLVGPGPRPDDPGRYSTSNMCIPIFPCVDHPTGRPPIRPSGLFPFSNCYHWTGLGMERRVRVAIRTYTEYDEDKVAHLPGIEHVEMEEFFSADYARCAEAKRIAEAVGDPQPHTRRKLWRNLVKRIFTVKHKEDVREATSPAQTVAQEGGASDDDNHHGVSSDSSDPESEQVKPVDTMEDLKDLEIYGLTYRADDGLLPIVNISLDLGEEPDISSPLEFIKEYDALVRAVRAAKGPSLSASRPNGGTQWIHYCPTLDSESSLYAVAEEAFLSRCRQLGRWVRSILRWK